MAVDTTDTEAVVEVEVDIAAPTVAEMVVVVEIVMEVEAGKFVEVEVGKFEEVVREFVGLG